MGTMRVNWKSGQRELIRWRMLGNSSTITAW